jgi:predicted CXXCH cytochrome family protein
MASKGRREGKGSYGEVGLPVAGRYLPRRARNRLLAAGGVFAAVLVAVAAIDFFARDATLLSNGPLSSDHSNLRDNCAACHSPGGAVTDAACSTCHERYGDRLGIYTFASHYLYRSTDFQRVVPSAREVPCTGCHVEHGGRQAAVTRSPDARCLPCHDVGSFSRGHPEFDFAADGAADSGALRFGHIHHVNELLRRQGLEPADVERTCLACHNPRPDGRGFEPIDFDRHCDACHLTTAERTPPLPVDDGGDGPGTGSAPGVETLEAIQRRGEPGTLWAYSVNPDDFRRLGDRVVKTPLYHRDPWVLYNLRRLRHRLYPDGGLADLLTATPDVEPAELRSLYTEAIAHLEQQMVGLRSRPEPEIQAELRRLGTVLAELRRRLEDPYAPLDETRFLLALGPPAALDPAAVEAVDRVADSLTEPCRRCHQVRDATIVRVQADQRTLVRAEFDHRAHIVQRRCLDCHDEIPIREHLGSDDKPPPEVDRAEIYDLPRIAQCRECHNPQLASESCVNCHLFHPDPARRSEMLLYVDQPPPESGDGAAGESEPDAPGTPAAPAGSDAPAAAGGGEAGDAR